MNFRKSSCTLFAATALALAGCGDSDSTTQTNPVPDLLITIGQQERKASGAKGSADMSLRDATAKATMLSAVKVMGESSVAEANAQAILDARGKVDLALTDATAALTALQEAKTEADGLPADTPKLEDLKAELATAITEATRHRDAIQALKGATGTGSLAKLVEKVTGKGGKGTPADIAAAVAQEVEKNALAFPDGKGSTLPPISGGVTPTGTTWHRINNYTNSDRFPKISKYGLLGTRDLPGVRFEETDYAYYGYWLAVPPEEDSILLSQIFGLPKKQERDVLTAALAANPKLGNTFTYSGKALGMSVLTERDGRNHKAIKSGEFTADVKLTATFAGTSSMVKGKISNFRGNAVGEDWSVDLKESKIADGVPAWPGEYGLTQTKGATPDGMYYARASYEPAGAGRPPSINGAFQAHFSNGRAAGGYGTVKDD